MGIEANELSVAYAKCCAGAPASCNMFHRYRTRINMGVFHYELSLIFFNAAIL
jgi:hypothetical protein